MNQQIKGIPPAFVEGDVYEFIVDNLFVNGEVLYTLSNNHGMQHTMEKQELDNSGHFELVEE